MGIVDKVLNLFRKTETGKCEIKESSVVEQQRIKPAGYVPIKPKIENKPKQEKKPKKSELENKCYEKIYTSDFNSGQFRNSFIYVLQGQVYSFEMTMLGGLNQHLYNMPRSLSYKTGEQPPGETDFLKYKLDEPNQKICLDSIIKSLQKAINDPDNQARAAISLVQHIPYGRALSEWSFPYQVLCYNKGVCGEKSELLAFFLRGLGFGTAILRFDKENHDAIGIRCPLRYQYKKTGYAFVETTNPGIITNSGGSYLNVGKLISTPRVLKICDGRELSSIKEEVEDAEEFKRLTSQGKVLPIPEYNRWVDLVNKYRIRLNKDNLSIGLD